MARFLESDVELREVFVGFLLLLFFKKGEIIVYLYIVY